MFGVSASFIMMGGMVYMAEIVQPSLRDRIGSIGGVLANAGSYDVLLLIYLCCLCRIQLHDKVDHWCLRLLHGHCTFILLKRFKRKVQYD